MITEQDEYFIRKAIELARLGMNNDQGGPFGALIVKDGEVIGQGYNQVTSHNDPTAHAEVVAIREACCHLVHFQLTGCTLYTSCEPCPMCLGAIYWARPERVVFAASRTDAAEAGFDDDHIYRELKLPPENRTLRIEQTLEEEGRAVFREWIGKPDKKVY